MPRRTEIMSRMSVLVRNVDVDRLLLLARSCVTYVLCFVSEREEGGNHISERVTTGRDGGSGNVLNYRHDHLCLRQPSATVELQRAICNILLPKRGCQLTAFCFWNKKKGAAPAHQCVSSEFAPTSNTTPSTSRLGMDDCFFFVLCGHFFVLL